MDLNEARILLCGPAPKHGLEGDRLRHAVARSKVTARIDELAYELYLLTNALNHSNER